MDGNTTAALSTIGNLIGLVASDANAGAVTVTASANYDNSAPGKNKPIRVVYSLNGTAKNNYQVPADYLITDAKISDYVKLDALAAPSNGCQGESLGLGYKIVAGDGVNYKITFDTAALAAGMKNIEYTAFPDTTHSGIISIPIPQTVKDGNFTATLTIQNELGMGSAVNTFPFSINVSADYIVSKFDDVVLCNNFSNRFVNYQWYKDGKKLEGATKQFYYDPAGLNGVYHLQVTTVKNEIVYSCSKSFTKAKVKMVSAYPNPLKVHQRFTVKVEGLKPEELEGASLTIYSLQGMKVYESKNVIEQNMLDLDLSIGVYFGKVITSTGLEHNFSVVVSQ